MQKTKKLYIICILLALLIVNTVAVQICNETVYAVGGYRLTYNGNGNTSGTAPIDSNYYMDQDTTVLGCGTLENTGYTFLGWATSNMADVAEYVEGDTIYMDSFKSLYAVWELDGGGVLPMANAVDIIGTLQYGEQLSGSYVYSDGNSDLEGISTYKWYLSDDNLGTNKQEIIGETDINYTVKINDIGKYISFEVTPVAISDEIGTTVESDLLEITLHTVTVTFNTNGGSDITAITEDYDTALTMPINPTKTGYTFAGWYTDEDLTQTVTLPYTITDDVTLYANWTLDAPITNHMSGWAIFGIVMGSLLLIVLAVFLFMKLKNKESN